MVAAALKPYYHRKELDKDKYTAINKSVSRMLYDKIWESGGLIDQGAREQWQKVATEEVNQAVKEATATDKAEDKATPVAPVSETRDTPGSQPHTTEVPMRPAAVKA